MPSRRARSLEPLEPSLLQALQRGDAYPDDPAFGRRPIQHLQTHLSHVFLGEGRVYKVHKAVDLGFVCFATRALRNRDSLRELRLNRRFTPDLYLGLAPLRRVKRGGRLRWTAGPLRDSLARDPGGGAPEHAVVMRRLPEGRDLRTLLARRRVRPEQIDAVARRLAQIHATSRATHPVRTTPKRWLAQVRRPILDNLESLASSLESAGAKQRFVSPKALHALRAANEAALGRLSPTLIARLREGRAVDGHGDLHLEHVWFERDESPPLLIDCLEFRDDLRRIDAASEVAFLAMDLAYRGAHRFAARFLRRYAEAADDFGLYAVVDLFIGYRAAVRAKVAAVAAADPAIAQPQRSAAIVSARRHLGLAARALRPRSGGAVILTCGIVGTGKSSAARVLGDAFDAPVIATDRVRKRDLRRRLAYGRKGRDRVYAGIFERAAAVVGSGRPVVLDATFDTAARRAKALRFARALGVPALLLETRCAPATTRARLAARRVAGIDPSDAGPDFHAVHAALFESPQEWPRARRAVLRTDVPWRAELRAIATVWRRALHP